MTLARFSKPDIANKIVRQQVRRCLQQKQRIVLTSNESLLLDLTSDGNGLSSLTTTTAMTTTLSGPSIPKPKRKQVRPTASAVQQWRTNNLKAKRHKSNAHKAAVRLYVVEKKKLEGMSIRQVRVQAGITTKYEESPSVASICRYAKQGLVSTSPMKMGPASPILTMAYKLVCQAYSSLVPINQECMRQQQFLEDDDPNDRGNVEHWHCQGDGCFE